jgi:hypothetical protein
VYDDDDIKYVPVFKKRKDHTQLERTELYNKSRTKVSQFKNNINHKGIARGKVKVKKVN